MTSNFIKLYRVYSPTNLWKWRCDARFWSCGSEAYMCDTSNAVKISWNGQTKIRMVQYNSLWRMILFRVDSTKKKSKWQGNFTFMSRLWEDSQYTATMRFYWGTVLKIHGAQQQAAEWHNHQARSIQWFIPWWGNSTLTAHENQYRMNREAVFKCNLMQNSQGR